MSILTTPTPAYQIAPEPSEQTQNAKQSKRYTNKPNLTNHINLKGKTQ